MKIRPVEIKLTDGQTDMTKLIVAFRNSGDALNKKMAIDMNEQREYQTKCTNVLQQKITFEFL
jgi:hypothetical protein